MRLMGRAASDPSVAARVDAAKRREEEWQARKLEEDEEKKKKARTTMDGQTGPSSSSNDPMVPLGQGTSSSSGFQTEPKGTKRAAEGQDGPNAEEGRDSQAIPVGPAMDQDLVDLTRRKAEKRVALEEPPKGEETK